LHTTQYGRIFHGLGQFAPAGKGQTEERRKEMRSLAAPKVSSGYHQQDTGGFWTMIAKCVIDDGKITQVGYLPCLINAQKQPEILKNYERGRQGFEFMDKITKDAGLNTHYDWKGDEIVIRADQI
jgi:poly-gamma-glutamate synthesis protein (capsule biosynthesis protein)